CGYVFRALHDGDPDARHCGQPCRYENCAGICGNISCHNSSVHYLAHDRHRNRGRSNFLPCAFTGPDSRASFTTQRRCILRKRRFMSTHAQRRSLLDGKIVRRALFDSLAKLNPRVMMRNPVMFVVEIGSIITLVLFLANLAAHRGHAAFNCQITLWLWFTVLFANFAEAMAEGRGKAQADALRQAKSETTAYRIMKSGVQEVPSSQLRVGDVV